MKYDVFISYYSKNVELAEKLLKALEDDGVRCWMAPRNIPPGQDYSTAIPPAVKKSKLVVVLCTQEAYGSPNVKSEIRIAFDNKVRILPFKADDSKLPEEWEYYLSFSQWLDAHKNPEKHLGKLVEAVRRYIPKEELPHSKPSKTKLGQEFVGIGALIHVETDVDCRIFRFGKEITVARQGEDSLIRLIRGKHKLEFVSLENETDRLSMLYPVPENDYEDVLTVELLAVKQQREAEEQAERERIAREKAEQERIAREKREKAEKERLAREKVYEVGDYYDDGTRQGVVFEVDATGTHGKIVSLTQSNKKLQWCSDEEHERKINTGASDKVNGMNNQRKIARISNWREKYPAFAWCADQGEGWYLPAIEELKTMLVNDAVHDAVKRTLSAKDAPKLYDKGELEWYWSSTEHDYEGHVGWKFCAWHVDMYYGSTHNNVKTIDTYVRAVFAF